MFSNYDSPSPSANNRLQRRLNDDPDSGLYGSQRSFGYSSHMSPSNNHSFDIPLDPLDQYSGHPSNSSSPTLAPPPLSSYYRNSGAINFSRSHNHDNPGRIYNDRCGASDAGLDNSAEAGLGIATGTESSLSINNTSYRENADKAFLAAQYRPEPLVGYGDDYMDNELIHSDRNEYKGLPQVPYNKNQYSNVDMEQSMSFSNNTEFHDATQTPLTIIPPPAPSQSNFAARFFLGGSKNGSKARLPWLVWTLSTIQIAVFIAELVNMGKYTGSPIATKPSFNPMIGPSSYVLINMGARFTPCMHPIKGITDDSSINFPCPNSTSLDTNVCTLTELCGMNAMGMGVDAEGTLDPRQWWRFITSIFLHAGFVHIIFNLLLQLKLGADLERDIGVIRFFVVYMASGIGGFLLGGNFTPDGIASSGASGSLFGIIALDLLDLIFNWETYKNPARVLLIHIVEIVISFVIGLLPGLDNFSHIGGFIIGILLGTALLRSPLKIRDPEGMSFKGIRTADGSDDKSFSFKGIFGGASDAGSPQTIRDRSKRWYVWGAVRLAALGLVVIYFALLIANFEKGGGSCSWCKYLSCLPVYDWCDSGTISTTTN